MFSGPTYRYPESTIVARKSRSPWTYGVVKLNLKRSALANGRKSQELKMNETTVLHKLQPLLKYVLDYRLCRVSYFQLVRFPIIGWLGNIAGHV